MTVLHIGRTAGAATFLVALLVAASIPAASASTVTITLNPSSRFSKVVAVSDAKIVFTYPNGSSVSGFLDGYNSSVAASGNFPRGESASDDFQGYLRRYTPDVSVQNMSVSLSTTAVANATDLVITKHTTLTTWVAGVFSVQNGTVTANLHWRSFAIPGRFDLDLQGRTMDINTVGSALSLPLSSRTLAIDLAVRLFATNSLWTRPTIDFSQLNSSLSTWTRNYVSATNTTTFTKTVSGQSNFSASVSNNGQKYSLSMVSDPSSTISVQGYAVGSGDSIMVQPTPVVQQWPVQVAAAVVLAGIAGAALLVALRRRRAPNQATAAGQNPSQACHRAME